jgi:ABC-type transport system, involved in lipoprotein release, permease component
LKLPFSLFLALRYLKPKRTFLSIITLISVIGVMLGVTVLILVISVMTGFDRELRQKVIDFDAHILVSTKTFCATGERSKRRSTIRLASLRRLPTSKGR